MHQLKNSTVRNERGFSLLEILVALAIIAVIVIITAIQLGNRAQKAQHEAIAGQVVGALRSEATLRAALNRANPTAAVAATELENIIKTALTDVDGVSHTSNVPDVDVAVGAAEGGCNASSPTTSIGLDITLTDGNATQIMEFEDALHAMLGEIPDFDTLTGAALPAAGTGTAQHGGGQGASKIALICLRAT